MSAGDMAAWLQAIFVAVGVVVALRALYSNRRIAEERSSHDRTIASKRSALEFVAAYEIHDSSWAGTLSTAMRVLENRELWQRLFSTDPQQLDDADLEKRRAALAYLNHNELVAIAIQEGALDRDMYIRWFGSAYKCYWDRTSSAVKFIRSNMDPDAFKEFEGFAESIPDTPAQPSPTQP